MPVITFIRGKDKRSYLVLDLNTNTLVKNVYSMRGDKGECAVYRVDEQGKLVLDAAGNPVVDVLLGRFKLLRYATDQDCRILTKNQKPKTKNGSSSCDQA